MKDIMIIQKDLKFFQMRNKNNAYNICIIKILNIYLMMYKYILRKTLFVELFKLILFK